MDIGEKWQTIAIVVLTFSLLAFVNRPYPSIESFDYATGLRAFEAGVSEGTPFHMLSSSIVALTSMALFAPVLGTLAILFIYLALRARFGSTPALIAAAILASLPAFTLFFSAGIYTPLALAFLLFAIGAYLLLNSEQARNPGRAALGALLLAAAALVSPASLFLSSLLALSLGVQAAYDRLAKRDAYLPTAALALAGMVIGIILAGLPELSAEPGLQTALISLFAVLPLALPGLAIALIYSYKGRAGIHAMAASLVLLSVVAAPYSLYAALFGAAFACAYALKWALREESEPKLEMLFMGLSTFAILFPLLYIYDFGEIRALSFALFLGAIAALSLKFYEGRGAFRAAAYTLALFALFSSLIAGPFLAQAQYKEVNSDVVLGLEWANLNTPPDAVMTGFGIADQIAYFSERQAFDDDALIARFLLTNMSSSMLLQNGIDYLIVDARSFDDLTPLRNASGELGVRMDSFIFYGLE
ncbi:MAG: glycosyltransferase family 39 protein, partial [Candidatus Aenigmarchaeota archaeon]|nr:glycosyltransferase family 39 protein [Candidatus Aenigmarchaeota archaeon]